MNSCELCAKVFESTSYLNKHLKSKSHELRRDQDTHLFKCECGRSFCQSAGLSRHRKKCSDYVTRNEPDDTIQVQNLTKENNEMREIIHKKDQEWREMFHKKDQELNELRKQVETLMARGTGNTTNRNSHNNTHIENQNVNIVVNSFGNENIEHLTDKIVCKLIQAGPFTCLPKII